MSASIEPFFTVIAIVFEVIGALAMVSGCVIAVVLAWRTLRRERRAHAAYLVLRTTLVLSMSIQIEIEGTLPWRRALLTSGGQVLASSIARERGAARADEAPDQTFKANVPTRPAIASTT